MTADRCSWRRQIRVVDSFFGSSSVVESLRVGLSRGYARRVTYSPVRQVPCELSHELRGMVCVHLILLKPCSEREIPNLESKKQKNGKDKKERSALLHSYIHRLDSRFLFVLLK
ncbi:hypothetical protein OROHE_003109 [Orobanche hederae]